jgi:leucine-rich repeat-containing protein 49
MLRNFRKLRELTLKDNNLYTLLQLAKLESLPSLRNINIENNPINKCSFYREFIVYRFPSMLRINQREIKEQDKVKAKNVFSNFDRILQIPDKFYSFDMARSYPSSLSSLNFGDNIEEN